MAGKPSPMGDALTIADCAAGPALSYANEVAPFSAAQANVSAHLARLLARASMARVFAEAQPCLKYFPRAWPLRRAASLTAMPVGFAVLRGISCLHVNLN